MAVEITMPQLSDTMDQGTILIWKKNEGDKVSRGDALAEVATDKADLEIESFHEGTLLKIIAPRGATVKVGSVIALIGEAGEVATAGQDVTPGPTAPSAPSASTAIREREPSASGDAISGGVAFRTGINGGGSVVETQTGTTGVLDDRVKISPLAKNLAHVYGVNYRDLEGSGEGGRIIRRDVERKLGVRFSAEAIETAISSKSAVPFSKQAVLSPGHGVEARNTGAEVSAALQSSLTAKSPENVSVVKVERGATVPLSKMRETIAQRMVESVTTAPHFYVTARLEVDRLSNVRETLRQLPQYASITFNHLILRAVALSLRAYPRINACYKNGALYQPQEINIGIVTALPDGLLIPVVKNADTLSLADIVAEATAIVQRARSGRPKSDDLTGGTFTISNIGKHHVEQFTAIINPGQGAILAVGGIQDEPVVSKGSVVCGKVMRVTLSVDHRIIDGVMAGEFLTELKRLIEDPVLLVA